MKGLSLAPLVAIAISSPFPIEARYGRVLALSTPTQVRSANRAFLRGFSRGRMSGVDGATHRPPQPQRNRYLRGDR